MNKREKLIEKGIIVIESCKTTEQLKTALNYIILLLHKIRKGKLVYDTLFIESSRLFDNKFNEQEKLINNTTTA